mmetsp:Transcript_20220/g.49596  ORF Transcript_20220/g.49596 Transcript_20220/m.49596 type:complete len:248 (-) Transcript_20220:1274-2017(-)
MGVKTLFLTGGNWIGNDIEIIKRLGQIIIVTPGRLNHLLQINAIDCSDTFNFTLDEADILLSYNFRATIFNIFRYLNLQLQFVLVTSTINESILNLSNKFMQSPTRVLIKRDEIALQRIKYFYISVMREERKLQLLLNIFEEIMLKQTIVFCNTIRKTSWLYRALLQKNFIVGAIHSKIPQKERYQVFKDFRNGKLRLLIATDIFSRGIDVSNVSLIINYDLPSSRDTFIHRVGRTGRFWRKVFILF